MTTTSSTAPNTAVGFIAVTNQEPGASRTAPTGPIAAPVDAADHRVAHDSDRESLWPLGLWFTALIVGVIRLAEEWLLGTRLLLEVNAGIALHLGFYWATAFVFLGVLRVATGRHEPWQVRLVCLGLWLGALPPLLDLPISGLNAERYSYLRNFPHGFRFWFYNPGQAIPLGEAVTLWLSIVGVGAITAWRTRRPWRGALALLLAYVAVVLTFGVYHQLLSVWTTRLGLSQQAGTLWRAAWHILLVLAIYFSRRPAFLLGLLRRSLHALPCVAAVLLGSALQGEVAGRTWTTVAFMVLSGWLALVHNDWHDREDDAPQGRVRYVEYSDYAMMNLVWLSLAGFWALEGSILPWVFVLIYITSVVYSCPPYRLKKLFPFNLALEGAWGASAVLAGIVAAVEARYGVAPAIQGLSAGDFERLRTADAAFAAPALVAVAAAFSGWCVVAATKDYKDIEADRLAGVQTVYTLTMSRGFDSAQVHRMVCRAAALCLLSVTPLCMWATGSVVPFLIVGAAAASVVCLLPRLRHANAAFQWLLVVIGVELLTLASLVVAA